MLFQNLKAIGEELSEICVLFCKYIYIFIYIYIDTKTVNHFYNRIPLLYKINLAYFFSKWKWLLHHLRSVISLVGYFWRYQQLNHAALWVP
jgi:hypothetical protein